MHRERIENDRFEDFVEFFIVSFSMRFDKFDCINQDGRERIVMDARDGLKFGLFVNKMREIELDRSKLGGKSVFNASVLRGCDESTFCHFFPS